MERHEIVAEARKIQTKADLINLLNRIKAADMPTDTTAPFMPITERHINFYCNPNNTFRRYTQFKIKKKSGGERIITAPRNASYKSLLHYVNELFKAIYTPSDFAMGFTQGRSIVDNATVHKGHNYVFNIDLKDFFPSIEQPRVWKRLQMEPFCFPKPIANILAGICCMKETRTIDNTEKAFYVLPQGAATSPIITNMICDTLDRRLAGLARRFGLHYTRYADDITFSSMHNVYQPNGKFITELHRIITSQGFAINDKKTRLQKYGSRQEVTGIVVSDKINVTRSYVSNIRNILYIWEKYGYTVASNKFLPKYKDEKGHVKKGNPNMINVIDGKLMYLKMVKGESDKVYSRLYHKFTTLVDKQKNNNYVSATNIKYLDTMSVAKFEQANNTQVVINITENKSDSANSNDCPRRSGYFDINNVRTKVSISKALTTEELNDKEKIDISNCLSNDGRQFWLIHKQMFIELVDFVVLSNDIDSLLT